MKMIDNPFRGGARVIALPSDVPAPSIDAAAPTAMLSRCPAAATTPLVQSEPLAASADVAEVWVKDERGRMGLGSFKALGAAYVIACAKAAEGDLAGVTYATASAGNHGLSVAAGARVFGAAAVVFIAETVPESFADRLRAEGATVERAGADYEASMAAASARAEAEGWRLLSDSSWPGYLEAPHRLMEGYLVLIDEAAAEIPAPPTHVFLQAGVGGFAGAMAALARARWGDAPCIAVVEPEAAPALYGSIIAGAPTEATGPVSAMGRLDCKEPSLIALKGLAHDADIFLTVTEEEAADACAALDAADLSTTPSGGAGLAALLASGPLRAALGLSPESRVLAFISEEAAA